MTTKQMTTNNALHLVWDNHLENVSSLFQVLYEDNKLVDVTIACRDGLLRAHKIILSACSTYFEKIFQDNPCKHPVIIIRGIRCQEMKMILEYIYKGFIDIPASLLNNLICVASELEIKGFENFENYQGIYQDSLKNGEKNYNKETEKIIPKKRSHPDDMPTTSSASSTSYQLLNKRRLISNSNSETNRQDEGSRPTRNIIFGDRSNEVTTRLTSEVDLVNENNDDDLPFKIECVVAEKEWENDSVNDRSFNKDNDSSYMQHSSVPDGSVQCEYAAEFVCSLCYFKCTSRRDFLLHQKSHVKTEKPHKCEFCPSSFTRSSHLARHRRMHTGERPFNCELCEKSFARQDKLKQHVRTSHANDCTIPTTMRHIQEKATTNLSVMNPAEPPKIFTMEEQINFAAQFIRKVKRGRGRPRKYPLIPTISVPLLGPKRGRGRPRKIKPSCSPELIPNIKQEARSPKPSEEEDYGLEMSNEEHITIEPLIEINTESQHLNLEPEENDPLPISNPIHTDQDDVMLNEVTPFATNNTDDNTQVIKATEEEEDDDVIITESTTHTVDETNSDLSVSIINLDD